jgi:hypothetical protein
MSRFRPVGGLRGIFARAAGIAAALAVSSSLTATPAESAPAQNGDDASRLIGAFSLSYNNAACRQPGPLAAHVEDVQNIFFHGTHDRYTLHAQTAAQIFSDRANAGLADCQPVYLIDADPFMDKKALETLFSAFSVVSISSEWKWLPQSWSIASTPYRSNNPAIDASIRRHSEEMRSSRAPFLQQTTIDPSFWNKSDAVIVLSGGNEGNNARQNKSIMFPSFFESGSLILTGALDKDGSPAGYTSALAPDLASYPAYLAGFCHPFLATKAEIDQIAQYYNESVSPQFGVNVSNTECARNGTSFVSPDIGGYVLRARTAFPNLTAHEITAAAYLATAQAQISRSKFSFAPSYKANARGNAFDTGQMGHGSFLPGFFNQLLGDLDQYKKQTRAQAVVSQTRIHGAIAQANRATFRMAQDETVIRANGVLVFAKRADRNPSTLIDHFPDRVTITSPAGTSYDIPLRWDFRHMDDTAHVRAGFSVSAWLGERGAGEWTVTAPEGFIISQGEMGVIGAAPTQGNTIDWLIDRAQAGLRQIPYAKAVPDPAPWRRGSSPG